MKPADHFNELYSSRPIMSSPKTTFQEFCRIALQSSGLGTVQRSKHAKASENRPSRSRNPSGKKHFLSCLFISGL